MGNSIFKRMFGKKEVRVLFMGLDCAGKTTTLYKLKLGEVVTTMPTIGFNVETIDYKNVSMTAWDMGGRDKMRTLHRHYFAGTSAIVYIVDSTDRERLDEAIEELLRSLLEDELRGVPVAILANKQDLPNAMTSGDVEKRLLSMDDRLFQVRSVCVFSVCATSGDGLYEALDWLTDQMSRSMARQYVTGETGKQSGKPVSDKDATPNNNANKDVAKLSYLSSMVASIKKMLM